MLAPLGLDQHIEDLAFGVDNSPKVDHSAVDFQIDLVEVPSRMKLKATLSQVGRDHRSEMIDPTPNGLVGHPTPRSANKSSTSRRLRVNRG